MFCQAGIPDGAARPGFPLIGPKQTATHQTGAVYSCPRPWKNAARAVDGTLW